MTVFVARKGVSQVLTRIIRMDVGGIRLQAKRAIPAKLSQVTARQSILRWRQSARAQEEEETSVCMKMTCALIIAAS